MEPVPPTPSIPQGLAQEITEAFVAGALDLTARSKAPEPGWESMPEVAAADALRRRGATPAEIRLFLTFCAAMDRARDADRLWANGVRLFELEPWCFEPGEVARQPLHRLADALRSSAVSQRHSVDSAAWRLIAESLTDSLVAPVVYDAVFAGIAEAQELLDAVRASTPAGNPLFPMLAGPKVGPMWVRMLVVPGEARIAGIGSVPVAVDVQVRKVTEYLGVTATHGLALDDHVRKAIQAAWQEDVARSGAEGPEPLRDTCAALDPALWFFGKWGCSFCERAGRRIPIHDDCHGCRLEEFHSVVYSVP